jgi:hypothetical protein
MTDDKTIPDGVDPLEYFLAEEKKFEEKFTELDREGEEIRKATNDAFAAVDKALEDARLEIEKDTEEES